MMPLAASFSDAILAIHILAAVIGFGVLFSYLVVSLVETKMDHRAMP